MNGPSEGEKNKQINKQIYKQQQQQLQTVTDKLQRVLLSKSLEILENLRI